MQAARQHPGRIQKNHIGNYFLIDTDVHPGNGDAVLTLKPNKSLSWKQTKLVFLFFACCLFALTLYFVLHGAWLVIPFTGLELLVLGMGLYLQSCWAAQKQIITVDDREVRISSERRGELPLSFPLHWFQIKLLSNSQSWYPNRLIVGSHGRFIEIGSYLVEEERERVAEQLHRLVKEAKTTGISRRMVDAAPDRDNPAIVTAGTGG